VGFSVGSGIGSWDTRPWRKRMRTERASLNVLPVATLRGTIMEDIFFRC
jgi:hypothetical protein